MCASQPLIGTHHYGAFRAPAVPFPTPTQVVTWHRMFSREVKLREAMKRLILAVWGSTTARHTGGWGVVGLAWKAHYMSSPCGILVLWITTGRHTGGWGVGRTGGWCGFGLGG